MVSKKYWEKPINEFVRLVKQIKKKEEVEILDFSFEVHPGVFSPIYSSDTAWFAQKVVPLTKGKTFLEIGSGTGIIACLASINGSSLVVATDINTKAIENITSNARLHALDISVRTGSVFDPILKEELFDVIFWNHPFYYADNNTNIENMILASVYDREYQCLRKFFLHGKDHLTKNGRLILGTSNVGRINLIKKMARDVGYKTSLLDKEEVPVYGKATVFL